MNLLKYILFVNYKNDCKFINIFFNNDLNKINHLRKLYVNISLFCLKQIFSPIIYLYSHK
jgi:hypothetical protein